MTLRLWGTRAEPFVQSLHASFAVGALVAPLLAEQFISHGLHSEAVAAGCSGGDAAAEPVWLTGVTQPVDQARVGGVDLVAGQQSSPRPHLILVLILTSSSPHPHLVLTSSNRR